VLSCVLEGTCTISVEENELIVQHALDSRDVELVETGLPFGRPGFTKYEKSVVCVVSVLFSNWSSKIPLESKNEFVSSILSACAQHGRVFRGQVDQAIQHNQTRRGRSGAERKGGAGAKARKEEEEGFVVFL
jgi:hypothetical protein